MSEHTHRQGYACLKCGGIGTMPSHRLDCPAHDAGALVSQPAVIEARGLLAELTEEPAVVRGAPRDIATDYLRDLTRQAIERIRALLQAIDAAAIGAL